MKWIPIQTDSILFRQINTHFCIPQTRGCGQPWARREWCVLAICLDRGRSPPFAVASIIRFETLTFGNSAVAQNKKCSSWLEGRDVSAGTVQFSLPLWSIHNIHIYIYIWLCRRTCAAVLRFSQPSSTLTLPRGASARNPQTSSASPVYFSLGQGCCQRLDAVIRTKNGEPLQPITDHHLFTSLFIYLFMYLFIY